MNLSGIELANFFCFYCEVGTEGVLRFSYSSCFKGLNSLEMHIMQLVAVIRQCSHPLSPLSLI